LAQRQFARHTRAFTLKKRGEFPQADAEAEADMIVRLHQPSLVWRTQLQPLHSPVGDAQGTNDMSIPVPAIIVFMLG